MKKNTIEVVGYAHWASFLINGDASGLSETGMLELSAWAKGNAIFPLDCLDVSEESFFAYPDGGDFLKGDCATYLFLAKA